MHRLTLWINLISGYVWGPTLITVLVGTGILLTIRLHLIQFRGFGHAIRLLTGKYDHPGQQGQISHFQALSAALSATIGTGNIAGVATAIAAGGPGAVFWMWMTAVIGMAIKFSSCTLAVIYRTVNQDGSVRGGPMYYIERGLGPAYKPLALLFAFCTAIAAFGIGNMVQSNSVADALKDLLSLNDHNSLLLFRLGVGVVLAILTTLVIIGGIKRIGQVASLLVPLMSIAYIGSASVILFSHLNLVWPALKLIIKGAFTPTAAAGGFMGSTVLFTIRMGVARGIFSNESGLGTAPMIHAAARTEESVHQGLVAMLGPFIDTLLICSMTALIIIISGVWQSGLDGAPLTCFAFDKFLPGAGRLIVSLGLALFAYSTLIGWYYYGEKGIEYLMGSGIITPYKWVYIMAIPLGAVVRLDVVWGFADIANGFMALPNLVAVLGLSGVVYVSTINYYKKKRSQLYNSDGLNQKRGAL
jgi:AGCS family alanine or glycine:cation symporter